MTDLSKPYTVKSNATRGARRMGLTDFTIVERDSLFYITVPAQEVQAPATVVPVEEPQPELKPETAAAVDKLHGMAFADLAKLAKSMGAPVSSSAEEIKQRRAARRAEKGIPEPVPVVVTKLPSYKDMSAATSGRKSDIAKPVAVVHEYLRANWGTKSRKALIADLVAKGINISTCRTQYQIVKGRIEQEAADASKAQV